jgi:hypothetical protein
VEVGSQPTGDLVDLTSLFSDPDLGAGPAAAAGLHWQLELPKALAGLIELDPSRGALVWTAGARLGADLAGAYRIQVSAADPHFALGDSRAIARGVIQVFVKVPGAPASALEDLISRLQTLPLVNGCVAGACSNPQIPAFPIKTVWPPVNPSLVPSPSAPPIRQLPP